MSLAQPRIEVALNTGPVGAAVWTDITDRVEAFEIERGIQNELDQIESGTLNLTLKNDDRAFDPAYAGALVNLVNNPSFEVDLTGWTADGTGTSANRISTDGAFGSACLELVFDGVSSAWNRIATVTGLVEGTNRVSVYIKRPAAAGDISIYIFCASPFADDSVVAIASGQGTPGGGWARYSFDFTYPAGADGIATLYLGGINTPAGSVRFDAVQVERGALTDYADGSLDNHRWAGTAHNSQSYRGGPYYPNVKTMRRVRVFGELAGTDYPMYHGYWEDIEQEWRTEFRGQAMIAAADGLLLLSMRKVTGTFSQQRSDLRIGALLDAVGWAGETPVWVLGDATFGVLGSTTVLGPSGDRDLAEGESDVQGITYDEEDVTAAIKATVEAENGLAFFSREGQFTFRGRGTVNTPPFNLVQATFGDDQAVGSTELPYRRIKIVDDEQRIWNKIHFTRIGGAEQIVENATSQTEYGLRSYKRDNLLITTDGEVLDAGNYWLGKRKDQEQRIEGLDFEPQGDDRLWPALLGLEIGSLVQVRRRPRPAGSGLIERSLGVGKIRWRFAADGSLPGGYWECSLGLLPSDAGRFWILDSPTASQLGSTTVLAY